MRTGRILLSLSLLLAGACAYVIYSSIRISQTTGLLKLDSTDDNAVLSISQANHSAQIVGEGSTNIRLAPGTYQVAASDSGREQFVIVKIYKKQTTSQKLNPTQPAELPSVDSIDFVGLDTLISSGLSNTQISYLKQYFFKFKPSTRVVAIPASTVQPAPHDPNTATSFSINFQASIDSFTYKAVISYTGISDLRLQLYDQNSGAQVYDSGPASDF